MLEDVLLGFCYFRPRKGYMQGMSYVASVLVRTHGDAEIALRVLVRMTDSILPLYWGTDLDAFLADCRVMAILMRDTLPAVAARLEAETIEPTYFLPQWFLTLFDVVLPHDVLLVFWDLLLIDGKLALYRAATALLSIASKAILGKRRGDMTAILTVLKNFDGLKPAKFAASYRKMSRVVTPGRIEDTEEDAREAEAARLKAAAEKTPTTVVNVESPYGPPPPMVPLAD